MKSKTQDNHTPMLDHKLRFSPTAPRMGAFSMARKLHDVFFVHPKYLLEFPPNLHQSLPSGAIPIFSSASRLCPQADPKKRFTNIDNNTHDLLVIFRLECLADSGKHDVEPELVDGNGSLVLELI